jgi:hypothetical protein
LVLLMRVAKLAPSLGFTRIEMSSGGESYKEKVGSHYDHVSEAAVTSMPLLQPIYRQLYRVKNRLRATSLRAPVRAMRALMLRAKVQLSIAD